MILRGKDGKYTNRFLSSKQGKVIMVLVAGIAGASLLGYHLRKQAIVEQKQQSVLSSYTKVLSRQFEYEMRQLTIGQLLSSKEEDGKGCHTDRASQSQLCDNTLTTYFGAKGTAGTIANDIDRVVKTSKWKGDPPLGDVAAVTAKSSKIPQIVYYKKASANDILTLNGTVCPKGNLAGDCAAAASLFASNPSLDQVVKLVLKHQYVYHNVN